jgi:hypothetical protein
MWLLLPSKLKTQIRFSEEQMSVSVLACHREAAQAHQAWAPEETIQDFQAEHTSTLVGTDES